MSKKVVKILLKQSNRTQTGFDFPGVPFHPAVVEVMFWEAKAQILEGGQRVSDWRELWVPIIIEMRFRSQ